MKRKMPKVLLVLTLMCVLALGAAVAAFAGSVTEDTDYGDGLVIDGSTGWNTSDGDNYLVTYEGTVVEFTNNPFVRDTNNWSNFIIETVSSEEADGITLRADAYGWNYPEEPVVNTPWYNVGYNWDWDDFYTICTENTEITLTAYQYSDNLVVFDIEFGDSEYWLDYYVYYNEGVPSELWFHVGADGAVVTVNSVAYAKAIESVDVKELSNDEFVIYSDFDLIGTTLTVTYADGTTADVTIEDSEYAYDAYGNQFACYIYSYDEEDDWYFEYRQGWTLYDTGTYTVMIDSYNRDGEWQARYETDSKVTVRYLMVDDVTSVTELELDEIYKSDIDAEGVWVWYSYTPEVSGYYTFRSFDNTEDPYVELYAEGDGILWEYSYDDDTAGDWNFLLNAYLEEGTTYYYKTCDYSSVAIFYVTLTESVSITEISVSELSQTELTQYLTEFDLTGTVVNVVYSNGETAELVISGEYATDSYGNKICYYIPHYNEEEDYYQNWWYGEKLSVPAGTYTVYIYDLYTGITDDSQSITVTAIEDSDEIIEIELLETEYTAAVENGSKVWFSFTPLSNSYYYFVEKLTIDDVPEGAEWWYSEGYALYYISDDGEIIYLEPAYDEYYNNIYDESGQWLLYDLTEGVTYYIILNYWGEIGIYDEDEDWYEWTSLNGTVSIAAYEYNHTHTYDDGNITFTWSDDYSTATAELCCDSCSETLTGTATVTSVTTEATATEAGSIVYTATVTINGVEYTDTVTVVIPATGETGTETENESGTETESGDETESTTDTSSTATSTSTDADSDTGSTGGTAPKTSDVSTVVYYALLLGAAAVIVVFAKKRANA